MTMAVVNNTTITTRSLTRLLSKSANFDGQNASNAIQSMQRIEFVVVDKNEDTVVGRKEEPVKKLME